MFVVHVYVHTCVQTCILTLFSIAIISHAYLILENIAEPERRQRIEAFKEKGCDCEVMHGVKVNSIIGSSVHVYMYMYTYFMFATLCTL